MVLENVTCLLPEGSSDKCKIICHKSNKRKQRIIVTFIQKTNSLTIIVLIAKKQQMIEIVVINALNTINIHQNYKTFEKKAFHGYNGPLKL
jgi:hypothetical protein